MAEREGLGSATRGDGSLSTGRPGRPELVIQGSWASMACPRACSVQLLRGDSLME